MQFFLLAALLLINGAGLHGRLLAAPQYLPSESIEADTFGVTSAFSTHLPLVVLELQDTPLPLAGKTEAILSVAYGEAENRPHDAPQLRCAATVVPIYYEQQPDRQKQDYFLTVSGDAPRALASLPANRSWMLLGGAYDKSLLRNYIGYTLAASLIADAPGTALCELLVKTGDRYEYRGVYLLAEGDLPDGAVPLLRTENYGQDMPGLSVIESGVGNFVVPEYWDVDRSAMEKTADTALKGLSDMFYAQDSNHFLRYGEVLDKEAYAAYFLINECLSSYAGMATAMYTYDVNARAFVPGPLWNFERALDNEQEDSMEMGRLAYQNAPFFPFILNDSGFIDFLINMGGKSLQTLNGARLTAIIDAGAAQLANAQARDWFRWQSVYFAAENALSPHVSPPYALRRAQQPPARELTRENGILTVQLVPDYVLKEDAPPKVRQFERYEQELIKLKYFASKRPDYVRKALPLLKNQKDLLGAIHAYRQNTLFAALFLVFLFSTIFLARRKSR